MSTQINAISLTLLHDVLMEHAAHFYPDEARQKQLVQRVVLALPELMLDFKPGQIERSLFLAMHRLVQDDLKDA
ncbi:hypothetical protein [Oryzifoliimicrobium ureilyticus]|uniref:hypothetical protein n=1 Tax=Oryzifoliimicrobium ureilyticus TaxID=3113724 RepID=UPI0030764ED9